MTDMSVAVLAKRLGVTQRRANQIVADGLISARRTDSGEWLVDVDSAEAFGRSRRTARGLTPDGAWALLFILNGQRVDWISESTRTRLKRRIRDGSSEVLAREVAGRTKIRRYRAANLEKARKNLLLTGRSATETLFTELLPDQGRLYGYVPRGTTVDGWAADNFLVPDTVGNVFLFANTMPAAAAGEKVPASVVAADLAISADARERAAGAVALEEMRAAWLSPIA
ncbi:hypothetical protein [Homoserinibacter sp. YIM 151385]|uniref:hypothetical protein n=1 Tax=Homoserinibacter sp. YIM 151385 TaxID=2985506 RepID=UPI0022F0DDBD|nr:hypothetical protein [Homoserinibacter sp. YIM 151385]WBU36711.1 hypothetical protein OF852_07110 [Homoserinibacter sp. YIM 151385]